MRVEYQVRQGKRKVYIHGAGIATESEAIDWLLYRQKCGYRGLYIVKLVPYGTSGTTVQVIPCEVKSTAPEVAG